MVDINVFVQWAASAGREMAAAGSRPMPGEGVSTADMRSAHTLQSRQNRRMAALGGVASQAPGGAAMQSVGKAFAQGGKIAGMAVGVTAIVGIMKQLLGMSKIFGAFSKTFFQMTSMMVDMAIMPMMPLMMKFLNWWLRTGTAHATKVGEWFARHGDDIARTLKGIGWTIGWISSALVGRLVDLTKWLPPTLKAIHSALSFINNPFGIFGKDRKLTGLQGGGVVTKPTKALIGEAGPEVVIPLDQFRDRSQEFPLARKASIFAENQETGKGLGGWNPTATRDTVGVPSGWRGDVSGYLGHRGINPKTGRRWSKNDGPWNERLGLTEMLPYGMHDVTADTPLDHPSQLYGLKHISGSRMWGDYHRSQARQARMSSSSDIANEAGPMRAKRYPKPLWTDWGGYGSSTLKPSPQMMRQRTGKENLSVEEWNAMVDSDMVRKGGGTEMYPTTDTHMNQGWEIPSEASSRLWGDDSLVEASSVGMSKQTSMFSKMQKKVGAFTDKMNITIGRNMEQWFSDMFSNSIVPETVELVESVYTKMQSSGEENQQKTNTESKGWITNITEFFSNIGGELIEGIKTAGNWIKDRYGDLASEAAKLYENIKENVTEKVENFKDSEVGKVLFGIEDLAAGYTGSGAGDMAVTAAELDTKAKGGGRGGYVDATTNSWVANAMVDPVAAAKFAELESSGSRGIKMNTKTQSAVGSTTTLPPSLQKKVELFTDETMTSIAGTVKAIVQKPSQKAKIEHYYDEGDPYGSTGVASKPYVPKPSQTKKKELYTDETMTSTSGTVTGAMKPDMSSFRSRLKLRQGYVWDKQAGWVMPKAKTGPKWAWKAKDVGYDASVEGMMEFQSGGIVPGPIGSPVPSILHGGETVLGTHLGKTWAEATSGRTGINGGGGGTINANTFNRPMNIQIYTTENATQLLSRLDRMSNLEDAAFFTSV